MVRAVTILEHLVHTLGGDKPVGNATLMDAVIEAIHEESRVDLRQEDVSAAVSRRWRPMGSRLGKEAQAYRLDFLADKAGEYLRLEDERFIVRPNILLSYRGFIEHVHPAFLIGMCHARLLLAGEMGPGSLERTLERQCPLGFPPPRHGEAYADNHVHFGGTGVADHPLMAFLVGDIGARKPSPTPHRRNMRRTLAEQPEKLVGITRLFLDAVIWQISTGADDAALLERVGSELRDFGKSKKSSRGMSPFLLLLDASGPARDTPHQVLRIAARWHLAKRDSGAFQALVSALCLHSLTLPDHRSTSQAAVLVVVQGINLIRRGLIMEGAGLTTFIEYFNSVFVKSRKSPPADRWNSLVGYGGTMADVKVSDIGPNDLDSAAGYTAKLKPAQNDVLAAPHPWLRYHLSYHFSRTDSAAEGDDALSGRRMRYSKAHLHVRQTARDIRRTLAQARYSKDIVNIDGRRIQQDLTSRVRAIDVAGNENHFPIEVFAPSLRWLREKPIQTYDRGLRLSARRSLSIHAGEDYSCLISGLRSVDETVEFCNLGDWDRLGHALALGVDPKAWARSQGEAYVPLQAHVDNLVWLWHQATRLAPHLPLAVQLLPGIERRITFFAERLLEEKPPPLQVLVAAWKLRRNCPLTLKLVQEAGEGADARYWAPDLELDRELFTRPEYRLHKKYLYRPHSSPLKPSTPPICVFLGDRVEVGAGRDCLTDHELDLIQAVQDFLIEDYSRRGITIEACPSSNTSIGKFGKLADHPIFRWAPPEPSLLEPGGAFNRFGLRTGPASACVNTDDPAIFPTTIVVEHELLRNAAVEDHGVPPEKAAAWIRRIRDHGESIFRKQQEGVRYCIVDSQIGLMDNGASS